MCGHWAPCPVNTKAGGDGLPLPDLIPLVAALTSEVNVFLLAMAKVRC